MGIKVRIERIRMATGKGQRDYAYAGYVLASDCPQVDQYATTTIALDGLGSKRKDYYSFDAATRPAEYWTMRKGPDRYDALVAHRKASRPVLLKLAQSVYPELADVTEWPSLWIPLPIDEGHATRYAALDT